MNVTSTAGGAEEKALFDQLIEITEDSALSEGAKADCRNTVRALLREGYSSPDIEHGLSVVARHDKAFHSVAPYLRTTVENERIRRLAAETDTFRPGPQDTFFDIERSNPSGPPSTIRVYARSLNGRVLTCMREFDRAPNGQLRPSGGAIMLPLATLKTFARRLLEVADAFADPIAAANSDQWAHRPGSKARPQRAEADPTSQPKPRRRSRGSVWGQLKIEAAPSMNSDQKQPPIRRRQ